MNIYVYKVTTKVYAGFPSLSLKLSLGKAVILIYRQVKKCVFLNSNIFKYFKLVNILRQAFQFTLVHFFYCF